MHNVKIEDIKPYKKNAKKHDNTQVERIAQSIKEYGFAQPIVVDKNLEIIVGHGRYEAAKSLGLEEVPVITLENLTPEQVKAYRITDNKLNESDWNVDLLLEELRDLSVSFDISSIGFDMSILDDPSVRGADSTEKGNMESYLGNTIKQIVLYFEEKEYEDVLNRFNSLRDVEELASNTEAVMFLLKFYEDNNQN